MLPVRSVLLPCLGIAVGSDAVALPTHHITALFCIAVVVYVMIRSLGVVLIGGGV